MRVGDFIRDTALVPKTAARFERSMRAGFISIRLRGMLAADTTLRDPGDPTAVRASEAARAKSQLTTDIGLAIQAVQTIAGKVTADETANKLLSLDPQEVDPKLVAKYVLLEVLATTPQDKRPELVETLVWWATAVDPGLLQATRIDDLHQLVDRRLRTVERMLYYVARKVGRGFNMKAIKANPTGPWPTGFKRIFEYHRLPKAFASLCQPNGDKECQAPALDGWSATNVGTLIHPFKVAKDAKNYWKIPTPPDPNDYIRAYNSTGGTAVDAVDKIFTASTDFKERNFLACDQVIHLLHIEGLLFARRKKTPTTTWLETLAARTQPQDWLRIDSPWIDAPFLVAAGEPQFFEHVRVPTADLQLGDHLIAYNHPVYDRLTVTGVFRLENSLVVQVFPKLLVQGHGVLPSTPADLESQMLTLVNAQLRQARMQVLRDMGAAPATGYPKLPLDGTGWLVRRVEPSQSAYSQQDLKADWWVNWRASEDKGEWKTAEVNTQKAEDKRKTIWEQQKVEFVPSWRVSAASGKPWGGFFPLWEPKQGKSGPVKINGKFVAPNEVKVTEPMVSLWTWYYPDDPKQRDMSDVIRPKV